MYIMFEERELVGLLFSISIMLTCAESKRGFYLLSAVNNARKCIIRVLCNKLL